MADVFSYTQVPTTEVWSISGALLTWSKGAAGASQSTPVPFVCNDLRLSYARQISPMYPINVNQQLALNRIDIAGNPQGTLTLGVLLGPTTELSEFLEAVSQNTCDTTSDMKFNIVPFNTTTCQTGDTKKIKYALGGLVLTSIGLNIQNQQGIATVSQPMQFLFTSLDIR